ncbi:hypothetical protein IID10_18750 [candidate division KSB1 bacterium]|nr:hypothetical protein [candidate division KSB1 bacterium]
MNKWCTDHNIPRRPIFSLEQLWQLAVTWYENRLTVDARRPAPGDMVKIFADIGLEGPFWDPQSDQWTSGT